MQEESILLLAHATALAQHQALVEAAYVDRAVVSLEFVMHKEEVLKGYGEGVLAVQQREAVHAELCWWTLQADALQVLLQLLLLLLLFIGCGGHCVVGVWGGNFRDRRRLVVLLLRVLLCWWCTGGGVWNFVVCA